jgi:glutathione S-transferase
VQPVDRPVFWGLVRTPADQRDMKALQQAADAAGEVYGMLDAHLAGRRFVEGEAFTLADLALGTFTRRWLGVEGVTKPSLPNLERWFAQFGTRPGFREFVAPPMS